ncbi:MAG: DUF4124 domain-containing protein [Gammaproteobacteria bacterium]
MSKLRPLVCATLLLLSGAASVHAGDGQLYRWVDKDGVVHFGDSIPPEYAKNERHVVNQYGVTVDTLPAQMNEEQLAERRRLEALAEAEQKRAVELEQRDNILLNTYLSIDEIEALRNRRKELLDGQIRVTEIYLTNLREKLKRLQTDASQFQPYNSDPSAPPIHDWLAKELSNTLNSILVYEKTLDDTRVQQTEIVAKFEADIDRFKHLKGMN